MREHSNRYFGPQQVFDEFRFKNHRLQDCALYFNSLPNFQILVCELVKGKHLVSWQCILLIELYFVDKNTFAICQYCSSLHHCHFSVEPKFF